MSTKNFLASFVLVPIAAFFISGTVMAESPTHEIVIKNHLFSPARLSVPADTKVKLIVHNQDPTPEEFESYDLNREKIIRGGKKAIIFIGPLSAGEYAYFGEFNPDTAQGVIVAE